jgi:hypothetical protein
LAVFAGGFDLAAAETIGAGGPVDALDVADLMDHLVDKSLVDADPSGPSSRFRLLEMIRDYMWDRLGESEETEEVSLRHAEFFIAFAAAAGNGLCGPDELSWTERLEQELDNMRAAVSWAIDAGRADVALEIIASLSTAYGTRIGAPFGPIAEKAAAMPQALGHSLRCVALASAARAARDRGDSDRAGILADSALDAVDALPPGRATARARCRTFSGVTIVLAQQQEHARLPEVFQGRLAAAMELDDPWEQFYARVGGYRHSASPIRSGLLPRGKRPSVTPDNWPFRARRPTPPCCWHPLSLPRIQTGPRRSSKRPSGPPGP